MNGLVYEAVSYAMRYWFIFVVVFILIALIYISYKEYTEKKNVKGAMRQYLGYLEIVGGPQEFIGDRFGIRDNNTIGSSRRCDIMLPDDSVLPNHARLYSENGDLVLTPEKGGDTRINSRRATRSHRLKTGDVISIGHVNFTVNIKRTRVGNDD